MNYFFTRGTVGRGGDGNEITGALGWFTCVPARTAGATPNPIGENVGGPTGGVASLFLSITVSPKNECRHGARHPDCKISPAAALGRELIEVQGLEYVLLTHPATAWKRLDLYKHQEGTDAAL